MRAAFAAVVGTATGLLVAGAPAANGLVLLLGGLIGVVLTLAAIWRDPNERETDPVPGSDGPVSRMEREEAYR